MKFINQFSNEFSQVIQCKQLKKMRICRKIYKHNYNSKENILKNKTVSEIVLELVGGSSLTILNRENTVLSIKKN